MNASILNRVVGNDTRWIWSVGNGLLLHRSISVFEFFDSFSFGKRKTGGSLEFYLQRCVRNSLKQLLNTCVKNITLLYFFFILFLCVWINNNIINTLEQLTIVTRVITLAQTQVPTQHQCSHVSYVWHPCLRGNIGLLQMRSVM